MANPAIAIKITNLREIRQAFIIAPMQMTRQLNIAIQKSAFTIQRQSMINTPVLTGRLRSSTSSQFSNLRGVVGTHTTYDVYVHEGTRYMKGRPYLRDAVESNESIIQQFFHTAVNNVLRAIGDKV